MYSRYAGIPKRATGFSRHGTVLEQDMIPQAKFQVVVFFRRYLPFWQLHPKRLIFALCAQYVDPSSWGTINVNKERSLGKVSTKASWSDTYYTYMDSKTIFQRIDWQLVSNPTHMSSTDRVPIILHRSERWSDGGIWEESNSQIRLTSKRRRPRLNERSRIMLGLYPLGLCGSEWTPTFSNWRMTSESIWRFHMPYKWSVVPKARLSVSIQWSI